MPATHATLYRQSGPNIYRRVTLSDSLFCTAFDSTYCSYCKNKVYTWCDRSFLCSRGCPSSSRRSWCRFCCSFDGCFSCHWLFGRHSEKECKKTSLKSSYILQLSICKHHRGALGDLKKETISLVKIKILTNLLSRTLTCSCKLN